MSSKLVEASDKAQYTPLEIRKIYKKKKKSLDFIQ